jgi:hypothetical protein
VQLTPRSKLDETDDRLLPNFDLHQSYLEQIILLESGMGIAN